MMGIVKRKEKIQYMQLDDVKSFLDDFRVNHWEASHNAVTWHRYVFNDHIKLIAEKLIGRYYAGTQLIRSVLLIAIPEEVLRRELLYRSIWKYDEINGSWELVKDSRRDGEEETNALYERLKLKRG
ncbi:hypothetical protein DRZ78_00050 [Candidatus Aerophobetes bacterium]|uniref:Uncharacterized protein n=1 Tax=Aerophobetes bacterium TaxID=2030807 RepID=A0A662D7J5_UNCAE|nr:MAG: hypothetical protein DRZ78_00050 [Candidatus Aerophobetes bacterium]